MNLKDFYTALARISQVLEQKDLASSYAQLVNGLTNFQSSPNDKAQEEINSAVSAIVTRNNEVLRDITKIPHSEFVVNHLGLNEYVSEGTPGVINNLLVNERHSAIDRLNRIAQQINNLRQRITTLITQFGDMGIEYKTEEDRSFISIEFGGRYNPTNTETLRKRLEEIESIFRAFAKLTDDPNNFAKPKIQSISKSSPLVIDIATATAAAIKTPATIVLIAKSVEWLMDRIEQGVEIKLKLQEMKKTGQVSEQLEPEFDQVFEKQVNELTADPAMKVFVDTLYEETGPHSDTNGAETEIKKDIKEAIKLLHKLLDGNSSIRPYLLPPSGEESIITEEEATNITVQTNLGYAKLENKKEELKALESGQRVVAEDEAIDTDTSEEGDPTV